MIFLNVLFPILVLILIGYMLTRGKNLNAEMLSKISFWFLSPALIFASLYENDTPLYLFADFGIFVVIFTLLLWAIALITGKLLKLGDSTTASLSLSIVFTNSGNYGLPLLLFALGEEGFALGVVYVAMSTLLMATLGVVMATGRKGISWEPLINIFKTPLFYAVVLAIGVRLSGIEIPEFVIRPIDLLAQAAIPILLILLGSQLVGVRLGKRLGLIGLATGLRLALGPVLAVLIAHLLNFKGLEFNVAVIEASMPAAVNALLIATYYKRDPRLASSVVLSTTVLSVISLTIILLLLGI